MTNPKNKKTHEKFIEDFSRSPLSKQVKIIGRYVNTDTPLEFECKHGKQKERPWALLKRKHCCRQGYYDSGIMWKSRTLSLDEIKKRLHRDRKNVDSSEAYVSRNGYTTLENIRCTIHNIYYSCIVNNNKMGLCPKCDKKNKRKVIKQIAPLAWEKCKEGVFVSKAETAWLNSLNVSERQKWLEDIKYKVDGYDETTNTVYLYHGKFWHGCPETYDPEEIHPIVKIPMKDLYERTMLYESKIKEAGYNLVVKWG